jgi:hypothetical protein
MKGSSYALVIYDLDDCCQAADVWTVGKEYNTANLDEPPLRGVDVDLCHLDGDSTA